MLLLLVVFYILVCVVTCSFSLCVVLKVVFFGNVGLVVMLKVSCRLSMSLFELKLRLMNEWKLVLCVYFYGVLSRLL